MTTRRQFIKVVSLVGAGTVLHGQKLARVSFAQIPAETLDPTSIPKYQSPLVIPPAMPRTSKVVRKKGKNIDYYEIAVRQFQQQILPPGLPPTTVWGYGSVNHPETFNYPSFTIEAKANTPVRVKWINQLVDAQGNYLPHLFAVDQTLHWANPPAGIEGRDMRGLDPSPYTGPVPLVTHVHGAHAPEESDGYAEAWFLPQANNIPEGYATVGSWYEAFKSKFAEIWGVTWDPGSAIFQYPNNQRAGTLWYHDHAMGMTRLNVYAGPAGFFLLRGGNSDVEDSSLPGPAPALGDPPQTRYYEIPMAIQDRAFNADGSLFYPDSRALFDEFEGPYIPKSDISPIWNPEFFGNAMVVNGKTWPSLKVERRRYRFRLLNGCDARFMILKLITGDPTARPGVPVLPFWQIGTEGGFLPAAVEVPQLLMAPAERADVIVDFTDLPVGTEVYLINEGPDEPLGSGVAGVGFPYADPGTTGQVMKFTVVKRIGADKSLPPALLSLPPIIPLGPEVRTRKVVLMEAESEELEEVGPREATLGILDDDGNPVAKLWMDPITENPGLGDTEIWEIYNFTADAHPIHLHEIQFEVINRQALVTDEEGISLPPARLVGEPVGAEAWETGFKDTVIAYPGQVTRIKGRFDLPGQYVWHCHIVEHEDNEMMRPYRVGP